MDKMFRELWILGIVAIAVVAMGACAIGYLIGRL